MSLGVRSQDVPPKLSRRPRPLTFTPYTWYNITMPQQVTPSWHKYPTMSGLWLVECTNDRSDKVDMSVEDFVVRGKNVRCVSYDDTLSDWQEYTYDYSYRYYGPIPNENA